MRLRTVNRTAAGDRPGIYAAPRFAHPGFGIRQRGLGLIEILIAVLVLSIGLLGIAAVQTRALANNSSAMAQSMATVASYSILDAMRADRDSALAGAYNSTVTVGACPTTSGTLAAVQLQSWCLGSGATPPDGLASLGDGATGTVACTNTGACTVTVTFDDSRIGAIGANGSSHQTTVVTRAIL